MTSTRVFSLQTSHLIDVPVVVTGVHHPRAILTVAGQTDALSAPHFLEALLTDADAAGWAVVRMQTSSCLVGSGATVTDHEDVDAAIAELVSPPWGMQEICLLATSTGVQIALKVLELGKHSAAISRVVLHGVVTHPREDGTKGYEAELKNMYGKGMYHELVTTYDVSITACRLAWSPFPTLQEAVWEAAVGERVADVAAALLNIHVPLLLMCCLTPGYKLDVEDFQRIEKVVTDAASTSEMDVAFFVGTADEQRRSLKVRGMDFSGKVMSFLAVQDERRHARQAEEADRLLIQKRRSSIGADVFMLR